MGGDQSLLTSAATILDPPCPHIVLFTLLLSVIVVRSTKWGRQCAEDKELDKVSDKGFDKGTKHSVWPVNRVGDKLEGL